MKNDSIMYSSSDFEHSFIRYKAESVPQGELLQSFCLRNKIPYNLFEKLYKDTRHKLVPVQVEGHSSAVVENVSEIPPSPAVEDSFTAWSDRYSDMTPIEKSKLIDELFSLRKAD